MVFEGTGDLHNAPTLTNPPQETFTVPAQADGYLVSVLLEFQEDSSSPLRKSFISTPPTPIDTGVGEQFQMTSVDDSANTIFNLSITTLSMLNAADL